MPERFRKTEVAKAKVDKRSKPQKRSKVVLENAGRQLKRSTDRRLKMPASKRKLQLRFSPSTRRQLLTLKRSKRTFDSRVKLKLQTEASRRFDALRSRVMARQLDVSEDLSSPTITASGALLSRRLFVGTLNITETDSTRMLPSATFFIKGKDNRISIIRDPKNKQTLIDGTFTTESGSFAFKLNPKTKDLSLNGVIKLKPLSITLAASGVDGKPNSLTAGFERDGLGVTGTYTMDFDTKKMAYSFMVTFDVAKLLEKLKGKSLKQ